MSSRTPVQSDFEIQIIVLACGHGDTVLVGLPSKSKVASWVLIDCNLQVRDGTCDRFFELVEKHRITRLEYIFQTHPDHDHFLGMDRVLEYFSTGGRSIGVYCDTGCPQQVAAWLGLGPGYAAYGRLQEIVDRLAGEGKIEIFEVSDRHMDIPVRGYDNIRFIPLAPNVTQRRVDTVAGLKKLAQGHRVRLEANALSIIMVLQAEHEGAKLNVLLAADAGEPELEKALAIWEEKAGIPTGTGRLEVVKVPHHGSFASHYRQLCARNSSAEAVATISCGCTRTGLPDQRVIRNYLDGDWNVLVTTMPKPPVSKISPLALLQAPPIAAPESRNDIELTWKSTGQLSWAPTRARVMENEIDRFTATR